MRKIFLFLSLILVTSLAQAQQIQIDPSFWWSGMQENELQLMVSGENIAAYTPELNTVHVRIKEVVRLGSPNYQIIYLDLSNSIPETFDIRFTNGKKN
ncbi:MAG: cyclomaltodextrinase N-terminal domain-containing protein, partial [Proteiniphilum sp.]